MPGMKRPLTLAVFPVACLLAAASLTGVSSAATAAAGQTAPQVSRAPQSAAPVKWSAKQGPVPKAKTNTAPALADVSLSKNSSDLFLFWAGPSTKSGFQISYQRSISLTKNTWSSPLLVEFGKAVTRSRPAAAQFGSQSPGQVIAVWKDAASPRILYSIGQVLQGVVRWGGVQAIPGADTSGGPAVFQDLHSNVVVVAWRATSGNALDDIVGFPSSAGHVKWGDVETVTGATTAGTPAIAEASTGTSGGELFILWQVPGSAGQLDFATTPDTLRADVKWTAPRALPPSVKTGAAPSAIAIGKGQTFPLLVVFRARHGSALSYVTLVSSLKATSPLSVPHLTAPNGTAISPGVLAAQDPGQVFYVPFVRACAGC